MLSSNADDSNVCSLDIGVAELKQHAVNLQGCVETGHLQGPLRRADLTLLLTCVVGLIV